METDGFKGAVLVSAALAAWLGHSPQILKSIADRAVMSPAGGRGGAGRGGVGRGGVGRGGAGWGGVGRGGAGGAMPPGRGRCSLFTIHCSLEQSAAAGRAWGLGFRV